MSGWGNGLHVLGHVRKFVGPSQRSAVNSLLVPAAWEHSPGFIWEHVHLINNFRYTYKFTRSIYWGNKMATDRGLTKIFLTGLGVWLSQQRACPSTHEALSGVQPQRCMRQVRSRPIIPALRRMRRSRSFLTRYRVCGQPGIYETPSRNNNVENKTFIMYPQDELMGSQGKEWVKRCELTWKVGKEKTRWGQCVSAQYT